MKRSMVLGALMSLLVVPGTRAQNPDDIEFRAEFVKKSAAFHAGEPMEVEISYASSAEKKYLAVWTSPQPFMGSIEAEVTPQEGVTDLRELERGWAGSIGSSEGYLSETPREQELELNQWFRFAKPGHFVLTVKSNAVSRRKREEEGEGVERVTLDSGPLAFDILPEDPVWQASELNEIEAILERAPAQSAERAAAMHRLSLLDSPAAVRKKVEIYLTPPQNNFVYDAYQGLFNSGQTDLIIEVLKQAMSDPAINPRAIGANLLAELQVRKEMGNIPARPEDPESQKQWQAKLTERDKTRNDFLAQANAAIVASLKQRTGKAYAEAAYEAWNTAQQQNAGKPVTATVEALRKEVLETASELSPGAQLNFVQASWSTMSHEQLRPILEGLTTSEGPQSPFLGSEAFELFCRDWPRDCAAAILTAAQQPETKIDTRAILLLPEAEHPELDAMLEAELSEPNRPTDSVVSERMWTLTLRAGSRKLVKAVEQFLDQPDPNRRYGCKTEAELIGYLFRFAAQDAAKRALEVALGEKNDCRAGILRMLDEYRYRDELLPVAAKVLDSGSLSAAASAALFLGKHGMAADEERLRDRLQRFWKAWSGRAAEMRSSDGPGAELAGNATAREAVQLEEALVSALVGSENWKLTDAEKEELRAGCMTENCRAMAEGKMSIGF